MTESVSFKIKVSNLEVFRKVYFDEIISKLSSESSPLISLPEHCEQQGAFCSKDVLPEPDLLSNHSRVWTHMNVPTLRKVSRQQKAQLKVGLPSSPLKTLAPGLDK